MPKVSEQHRKAQEDRFVDAARRCFTRVGVERTSMEEIRTEAGVSAGLMYRYFASKDDMVRAAISSSMAELDVLIADVGENPDTATAGGYLRALLDRLNEFRWHSEGVDLFRLALQGWAHAQSRPDVRAVINESLARQLTGYRNAARRWTTPAKAEATAGAISAAVVGYVVQSVFADAPVDVDRYCTNLTLLSS